MLATRQHHWSESRASESDWWLFWAVGIAAFALACLVPSSPLFGEPFDSPSLQRQAEAIVSWERPYRDVALEYQPGALLPLVLPAVAPGVGYGTAFKLLGCIAMIVLLAGAGGILSAGGRSRSAGIAVSALIGASPILLGGLALNRFDLWPAALTSVSIALGSWRPSLPCC